MPRRVLDSQTLLCPVCQHRIVTAQTTDGRPLAIDVGLRAYHLILNADNVTYRAETSSAYPVHACHGRRPTAPPVESLVPRPLSLANDEGQRTKDTPKETGPCRHLPIT